jgi:hypothetical protein
MSLISVACLAMETPHFTREPGRHFSMLMGQDPGGSDGGAMMTSEPSSAAHLASSKPMPVDAPVTTAKAFIEAISAMSLLLMA